MSKGFELLYFLSVSTQLSIQSSSLVDDGRLMPDIAIIKEAVEHGVVNEIRLVKGEQMLGNCLTKQGASGQDLMEVLRT